MPAQFNGFLARRMGKNLAKFVAIPCAESVQCHTKCARFYRKLSGALRLGISRFADISKLPRYWIGRILRGNAEILDARSASRTLKNRALGGKSADMQFGARPARILHVAPQPLSQNGLPRVVQDGRHSLKLASMLFVAKLSERSARNL